MIYGFKRGSRREKRNFFTGTIENQRKGQLNLQLRNT